ncbi:MAG: hypothetical protein IPP94_10325 [Ignavibacteria bacterium]|nr:hypothetical protein [Ignavibacteria bacterium]
MLQSLDPIIATAAVVLGLSLIVQALQQIMKQWLDLKSRYMRLQLLGMFDASRALGAFRLAGLQPVGWLGKAADDTSKAIVAAIEHTFKGFGYKDLELLETMSAERFRTILDSIDWTDVAENAGAGVGVDDISARIDESVANWFDLSLAAFQNLYERRMKLWSFLLSAAVVLALNANLFAVHHEFSVNAPLRDAAIAWAGERVAARTEAAAAATDAQRVTAIAQEVEGVRRVLGENAFQMLGWDRPAARVAGGAMAAWLYNIFGWAAMILLVSLGAPFWYDVLRGIVGIKNRLTRNASPSP